MPPTPASRSAATHPRQIAPSRGGWRAARRCRGAAAAVALAAGPGLAGCDRATAPDALRAATRLTAGLLPPKTGGWGAGWRRSAFARFDGGMPAGTPVTVLVDGAPVEFRAVVWERAVDGGPAPARCAARPTRTLLAWRGDPVDEGVVLIGEVMPAAVAWTGPVAPCYEGGAGHAPLVIAYPRDSLELPWLGVAGAARIDAPVLAGACALRADPTALQARVDQVTCREGTYAVAFRATLAQTDRPSDPLAPSDTTRTRTVELAPTTVAGARFTVHCAAGAPGRVPDRGC